MQSSAKKRFDVLGTTPPRADAYEKVTGRARYTADMHLPDMLYGGGKSAGIASGRIVSIDASRARAIPGVRCVLTPADVKKHVSCSSHRYITDRPRFCGDLVALVAAESPALVQQALDAITVQYEAYPAVLSIRDALSPDAPGSGTNTRITALPRPITLSARAMSKQPLPAAT